MTPRRHRGRRGHGRSSCERAHESSLKAGRRLFGSVSRLRPRPQTWSSPFDYWLVHAIEGPKGQTDWPVDRSVRPGKPHRGGWSRLVWASIDKFERARMGQQAEQQHAAAAGPAFSLCFSWVVLLILFSLLNYSMRPDPQRQTGVVTQLPRGGGARACVNSPRPCPRHFGGGGGGGTHGIYILRTPPFPVPISIDSCPWPGLGLPCVALAYSSSLPSGGTSGSTSGNGAVISRG